VRWISFAIVLYAAAVFQSAAAPYLSLYSVRPNLLVVLAVFYALEARRDDAMLACWMIGLVMDLTGLSYVHHGVSNVGLCALGLGLMSVVIVKLRELTFRESVWSQLFFCFAAQAALFALIALHMAYALHTWEHFGRVVRWGLYAAVYTAVVAPYGHWVLRQFRGTLGVGAGRFGGSYSSGLR